jgi:hypothetical protein
MPLIDQMPDQGPAHDPGPPGDRRLHVLVRLGSDRTVCQKALM